ncbi:TAP-like domain-containing protein [Trichoderma barbatum]
MLLPSVLLGAALASAAATNSTTGSRAPPSFTPSPLEFNWLSIVPSEQLEYHDCYNGFKCARLVVPLDWKLPKANHTVAIAMVKLPAVVPDDDPTFGGTIIVNPGGPGASGVDYAVNKARSIQKVLVDKPGIRHYEILSFDPRGIGRSTPVSDCFRNNDFARTAWMLENRAKGSLDSGKSAISYGLGLAKYFAQRCKLEQEQFGGGLEYINTPSVARDMVEMIDKIDELRKRKSPQKQRLTKLPGEEEEEDAGNQGQNQGEQDQDGSETQAHSKRGLESQKHPVPRLQYLGFSYGTILGNTFASMFPGRVGRMVLDGVANAPDYYNGDGWFTNLDDTDLILDKFWRNCYKNEPSVCPFRLSYRKPKDVKKHFWLWIQSLDRYPVPMSSANGGLLALTGHDVLAIIGSAFYKPLVTFRPLAQALYEGMSGGNLTLLADLVDAGVPKVGDTCQAKKNPVLLRAKDEQGLAYVCGDGFDVSHRNTDYWAAYVKKLVRTSRLYGPHWASIRFACSDWPFRPNWEFRGPYKTPAPSSPEYNSQPLYSTRPAAPLLFLTSRLDPVTPLSAARAMAERHPESGVLIQESIGHCAWASAPSKCTWKAVSDYFHSGRFPQREISCPVRCTPWDDECRSEWHNKRSVDDDEQAWWDALDVNEPLRPRPFVLGIE